MPTPRKYSSSASRQAAYRARQAQAVRELMESKGLPVAPPIPTMPADRRWRMMMRMALSLLETAASEMHGYFNERSESWQDSEQGELFAERLDILAELIDSFESLDISAPKKEDLNGAA